MTQEEALSILKTGANVFLTGEPGSGKTHTINRYIAYLRSCGIEPAITASTGLAATHIGGFTIHSWSGIGVRRELSKYDLDRIAQNRNVVRRVGNARVLIIDEVSMLSARALSMVDAVCRETRRNREPFGGLQVILVGDFFQLPPISKRNNQDKQSVLIEDVPREEFAYQSSAWKAVNPVVCYLSEQHRHEDPAFLEFLSSIRRRRVGEKHKALLRLRYTPKPKDKIIQLYSHNADVETINDEKLKKLPGKESVFKMQSRGPKNFTETLKRGCLSPETLALKVGARVMFTKNDIGRHRYVNGTLGIVTGFSQNDGYPIVKTRAGKTIFVKPDEWRVEDGGRALARIIQVPLRLAWAITIHKSQGMSLDAAHMDLSETFEYGQGYVALSRVRTLKGLFLAGLNERALEVHPEVCAKDSEFRARSDKARQKFSTINERKLKLAHANFIQACGGSVNAKYAVKNRKKPTSTYEITHAFLKTGKTFTEIAKERGMALSTIISHAEKLAAEKKLVPNRDLVHIARPDRFEEMKKALERVGKNEGKMLLSSARALLNDSCSYEELRLTRLLMRQVK